MSVAAAGVWEAGVLGFVRLAPVALWTPVLGGAASPVAVRLGMAAVLGGVLGVASGGAAPVDASAGWGLLVAHELLVGAVLAWLVRLVFDAARAAGAVVDASRGGGLVWAMAPRGAADSPEDWRVFARYAPLLVLGVFAGLGGLRALVTAWSLGLERAPVGGAWAVDASLGAWVLGWSAVLFEVALLLAAPWLVMALVLDLCFGVLGRATDREALGLASGGKAWLAVVLAAGIGGALASPSVEGLRVVMDTAAGGGWLGVVDG